jgi:hypothetical protein
MKSLIVCASALVLGLGVAAGQPARGGAPASPPATATAAIDGKTLTIKYSAPSVRGRQIFGPGGLVSKDSTYPAWRAGANNATAFHTDADLELGGLSVPKGDYTLFVNVKDPDNWELIVNKQTGQWGLTYDQAQDLGRVKMKMSKPGALVELLKWSIKQTGPKAGTLELEWENHVATAPFTLK